MPVVFSLHNIAPIVVRVHVDTAVVSREDFSNQEPVCKIPADIFYAVSQVETLDPAKYFPGKTSHWFFRTACSVRHCDLVYRLENGMPEGECDLSE